MNLPTHARVVIVGGGIAGCSTAYHLARLGISDVLLIEQGTHAELLARGGLYARLWAHQSGGFLGEEAEDEAETGVLAAK